MNLADCTEMLAKLLPEGPAWEGPILDEVVQALAGDAARAYADADTFLENFLPDTTVDFLVDWERVLQLVGDGTDEEREDAILAQLRGYGAPSFTNLQSAAEETYGDRVLDQLYHLMLVDEPIWAPLYDLPWAATYVYEYATEAFICANRDQNLATWAWFPNITPASIVRTCTAYLGATANVWRIPVGEAITIGFPAVFEDAGNDAYVSFWIRTSAFSGTEISASEGAISVDFSNGLGVRANVIPTSVIGDQWTKVAIRQHVAGVIAVPFVVLANASTFSQDLAISWTCGGEMESAFENNLQFPFPVHTYPYYQILEENGLA